MNRKTIRMEAGGIRTISRNFWGAAEEKLDEAAYAIKNMETALDRIAFEQGWCQFVDALEEFWTRFYDEGKTSFTTFEPWAGYIKAQKKEDALLQYLYQARHQNQHGRIAIDWEETKLLIAPGFNGHLKQIKIFPDETYEFDAKPSHPTLPEAEIVLSPGKPNLPVIENKKHGQSFIPPKGSDGRPLRPIKAAHEGIVFYKNVLAEAIAKFIN
jgi:hypothetical protein